MSNRVIIHVDADCFEVQLWTRDDLSLQNKPVIVTNASSVALSANYPARKCGISAKSHRQTITEALEKCPDLIQKIIPNRWGKPDVRTARFATYSFIDCVKSFRDELETEIVVDFCGKEEFYMDVTKLVEKRMKTLENCTFPPDTFYRNTIVECDNPIQLDSKLFSEITNNFKGKDWQLLLGGLVASRIVEKLKCDTGFEFSAGVASNKLLATLACAKNKPSAVTILTEEGLTGMASLVKIEEIRRLGGKVGQIIKEELGLDTMQKLRTASEQFWIDRFGTTKGHLIYRLSWGIDNEEISETSLKSQFKCSLNLLPGEGKRIVRTVPGLHKVLNDLSEEMVEMLQEERVRNKRRPSVFASNLSRPTQILGIPCECVMFNAAENVTMDGISEKSMELLQEIWSKHGMRPLHEITEIRIVAKKFVAVENDD